MRRMGRAALALLAVALAGCATRPHQTSAPAAPPAPEPLSLTRTAFTDLPGWPQQDLGPALDSFRRGCAVLAQRPDTAPMSGLGYGGTAADWRGVCVAAKGDARAFFETNFTPYAVRGGDGLFTGYYEPQIRGSRKKQGAYQTPVYGVPSDLVQADLGLFSEKYKGERIAGRVSGGRLLPYPDRAAIETQGLKTAKVLFYTDDPVAFFFLQIQGSGRVVFDIGEAGRVAYAGQNGQAYTAIGRTLIAQGALTRETVSLQTIRAWLLAHPAEAARVMRTNRSFVFFQEKPLGDTALGATGSLGAPLTPLASLAVDARLHALGAPMFVAAEGADPVRGLLMAQDTGGAIRGPVRGDIYFGFGDSAEARAGRMNAPGRLFVLLPNGLAQALGAGRAYPSQTPP